MGCLLSLTWCFYERQSSDFFENKRKKTTVKKLKKADPESTKLPKLKHQHYFAGQDPLLLFKSGYNYNISFY